MPWEARNLRAVAAGANTHSRRRDCLRRNHLSSRNQRRSKATLLKVVLGLSVMLLAACGDRPEAPGSCQTPPPPEAAAKDAIDRITDNALRDAMAGKPVMPATDRTAARRQVVTACVHRSAYEVAERGSIAEATNAAVAACAPVIDRFVKVEALEAALGGDAIPDPGTMADLRASFRPVAEARVQEAKAGRCWRTAS